MKNPNLLFLSVASLVGLMVWAVPLSAKNSAASRKVSVNASAIDYNFDNSALDRSNKTLLSSYSDMLDKVTPGVVGVYPSSKINPDAVALSTTSANGGRRGGNGGGFGPGGNGSLGGVPAPGGTGGGRRGGGRRNLQLSQLPPNRPDWTDANSTDYWFIGVGSGCVISADGYILTNHHVVSDDTVNVDAVLIKLPDGREFPAKVIGSDESTDLALLKIDAKNLPTIKMADSDKLRVGDVVFAIGNPMDVGLTVTHGIISAIGRSQVNSPDDTATSSIHVENFIQTDASINEGNSGGPLVDAEGRLIGLNSEILSASSAGGSIGIGFAVPANLARHVADDLIQAGKVGHGGLGVVSQEIDHNLAQVMGIPNTHGAIVTTINDNSLAAKNGLQRYDVVLKVNDNEVDSPGKLSYLVALGDPGASVKLTVLRDGKPKVLDIVLDDRDKLNADNLSNPPAAKKPKITQPVALARNNGEMLTGVSLMPLTPDTRASTIPPEVTGLIVTDMVQNSPFFNIFRQGSVIMEVNKVPVNSLDDLKAQLKPGALNMFYIYSPPFNSTLLSKPLPAEKELVTEFVPAAEDTKGAGSL